MGRNQITNTIRALNREADYLGIEIPDEMLAFVSVLAKGAEKYPANNWLKKDGLNCNRKNMYASIFRHVAEAYCGKLNCILYYMRLVGV